MQHMAKKENDWKERLGIVYSTNASYNYETDAEPEAELLPPSQQKLRVQVEKHGHGGKTVTIVRGFTGPEQNLSDLARKLKTFLGCGGSVKDGEILIQGDLKEKTVARLISQGYSQTK